MKPYRRRKARSMIAAGRMGRYEIVAAHPEEAAKMAGRKECVPTGYNIVLGDREIMRRTCT